MAKRNWFFLVFFALALAPIFAIDGMSSVNVDTLGTPWYDLTAHEYFKPAVNDISMGFLSGIFGFVPGSLGGGVNPFVQMLFRSLNLGVILVAGSIVSYTVVANVVRTAQDGGMSPMGKVNGWTFLRVFGGFSILLPTPQIGYSFIQMLIMWAVAHGVGLADTVWNSILGHIAADEGKYGEVVLSESEDYKLTNIFLNKKSSGIILSDKNSLSAHDNASVYDIGGSAMCLAVLKKAEERKNAINDPTKQIHSFYSVRSGNDCAAGTDAALCFGSRSDKAICGSYTWGTVSDNQSSIMKSQVPVIGQLLYGSALNLAQQSYLDRIREQQSQASTDLTQRLFTVGCDEKDCSGSSLLFNSATILFSRLKGEIYKKNADIYKNNSVDSHLSDLKKQGWASAGKAIWTLSNAIYGRPPNKTTKICVGNESTCIQGFQLTVLKPRQALMPLYNSGLISGDDYRIYVGDQAVKKQIKQIQGKAEADKVQLLSYGLLPALSRYNDFANKKLQDLLAKEIAKGKEYSITSPNLGSLNTDVLDKITSKLMKMLYYNVFTLDSTGADGAADLLKGSAFHRKDIYGFGLTLDVAQNNLKVLTVYALSAFTGLATYDFSDSAMANTWDDGKNSSSWTKNQNRRKKASIPGKNAEKKCDVTTGTPTGCFNAAWDNKAIQSDIEKGPLGLLGSVGKVVKGKNYNPIKNIRSIGVNVLNLTSSFWYYLPQGVLNSGKALLAKYQGKMVEMGWISSGVQAGLMQIPYVGTGLSIVAQTITNALMTWMSMEYSFDMHSLLLYVPIASCVSVVFFSLGAILSAWIPVLPFLIFFLAVIGWVISVIEAMVAAPLVAMGITYPEGQDFLGQSQQSFVLLLGVFLRPVVILFSFIFSIILFYIILQLMHLGFVNFLNSFLSTSSSSTEWGLPAQLSTQVPVMISIFALYTYLISVITQNTFAATYKIPEKIQVWIGGMPEQSMLPQVLEQVKSGYSKGTDMMGSGGEKTAGQQPRSETSIDTMDDVDFNLGSSDDTGSATSADN